MSATTVTVARHGRRGARAEPTAVERDPQVAVRGHERAPDVRLAGAQRAVGTEEQQAVVARGPQREHRRARLGIDEDLVPRRGAQRRAPLTQRVGRAHEAHGVDRVIHQRAVCGIG